MKLSERWLREWVNPSVTAAELAHKLNMAGLECEAEPLMLALAKGVVVGRILTAEKHPQADRLQVCTVDVGAGVVKQIVCGAPNARVGLCAPVALPGASLPGGMEIKDAQLRGVDSSGMLCSAKELALSAQSEGLLELDADALPGTAIEDYLQLEDQQLVLELTPNRGDCLSIAGLARETAALFGMAVATPAFSTPVVTIEARVPVAVENPADCSAYAGRVIQGINPTAKTPDWLREKLRRSGIRSIHPIVDITNFVMLETGQPMHAFDLAKLKGGIVVRRAKPGESCKLLTEDTLRLNHAELLITDESGAIALAGVMGGFDSGVGAKTTDIFFESAAFAPAAIVGTARRFKLSSDASYRFERGVDPSLHLATLERATSLALQICGGSAGPVSLAGGAVELRAIELKLSRLNRLLGQDYSAAEVQDYLTRLGVSCESTGDGQWHCTPPTWRFDLAIEADLIEEVARIKGYEHIISRPYDASLVPTTISESKRPARRIKDALAARGWQEVITYSFVDEKIQSQLTPHDQGIRLDNPIAETMNVMRTTLWTGLIAAWLHNHSRQQPRVRIFEIAATFAEQDGEVIQTPRLAGLAHGSADTEQWGRAARPADFFDVKADLEALIALFGAGASQYSFSRGTHAALHPGRCANVLKAGVSIGVIGELHPQLVHNLDLPAAPLLFELDWNEFGEAVLPSVGALSEFPASRRDLAIVVLESVDVTELEATIRNSAGAQLRELRLFDIYRGKGLEETSKSLAFGLIFQDFSRTLNVEEVDAAIAAVVVELKNHHGAILRN